MTEIIHAWLSVWIWVATAIAIAFTIVIIRKWNGWDWPDRLVAIWAVWIVPHVWEEWIIPGGFHYIYNRGSVAPDRYPMSELTDMITNFGLLVVGVLVVAKWGARPAIAVAAMLFCLLEVVAHTTLVGMSLKAFGPLGQTAWYAPGLVTALAGYLPLLIGFVLCIMQARLRPNLGQWIAGVVMMGVLVLIIFGPESVLKDPQSPYPFPNHGYYDRFVTD